MLTEKSSTFLMSAQNFYNLCGYGIAQEIFDVIWNLRAKLSGVIFVSIDSPEKMTQMTNSSGTKTGSP
jgi:hypothetical protein